MSAVSEARLLDVRDDVGRRVRVDPFTNGRRLVSVWQGDDYVTLDPSSALAVVVALAGWQQGTPVKTKVADEQGRPVRVCTLGQGAFVVLERGGRPSSGKGSRIRLSAGVVPLAVAALSEWLAAQR